MREKTYIFANKSYGLYYGKKISYDPVTEVAVIGDCRHICRWYGRPGGITSLAAHGLCGPRAGESRVAAPCPRAEQAGVVNVMECTPEAADTIEAAGTHEG